MGQLRTVTGASERVALEALKAVGWASVEAAVEHHYSTGGGGGGGGSAAGREAAEAKKAEAFYLEYKGESEKSGFFCFRAGARGAPSLLPEKRHGAKQKTDPLPPSFSLSLVRRALISLPLPPSLPNPRKTHHHQRQHNQHQKNPTSK